MVTGVTMSGLAIGGALALAAYHRAQQVNAPVVASPVVNSEPVAPVTPAPAPSESSAKITNPARITVARLDDAAFDAAWKDDPKSLGPVSTGRPNRGFLYNGVQLPDDGVRFRLEEPENSYGTAETIAGLSAAVEEVHRLFPETKPLSVGHISRAGGGWLRPHKSHQNGRDVDVGFYYSDASRWYRTASAENLDVARTWALLSAMERAAGLEYVFVDRSLHDLLRQHAEAIGEPAAFIEYMFDGPMPVRGPIIRHARGHQTHLHVRFASPIAVENATRVARRAGKFGRNSGELVALLSQNARPRATKAGKHTRYNSRGAGHNSRRSGRGRVKAL